MTQPNILVLDKDNKVMQIRPEHFNDAIANGLEPAFHMKTPDGQETYVRKRDFKTAQDKGLKMAHEFDAIQPKDGENAGVSKGESAVRGATNVMTQGLADEIGGATTSFSSLLGGGKEILNSMGIGEFDDRNTKDYNFNKDMYRQRDDAAFKQNPASYIAGGVAGFAPQLGASTIRAGLKPLLAAGVSEGALQGFGGGTDFTNEPENRLKGTAIGAGFGLGGAAGGKVISKIPAAARGISDAAGNLGTGISAASKNIGGAMKNAADATANEPAVMKAVKYPVEVAKGLLTTATREGDSRKMIKPLAAEARKLLGEGFSAANSGKNLADLTDEEAIILAMTKEGPNQVKEFVAAQAASVPGRYNAGDVKKTLELGSDKFNEALEFNKRLDSSELMPELEGIRKALKTDKGTVFGHFKEAAGGEFNKNEAYGIVTDLKSSLADMANSRSIGATTKNAIADALDAIQNGKAMSKHGLTPKKGLGVVDGREALNRLHAGRQILDDVLKGMDKKSPEYLPLKEARDSINARIKTAPSMAKGDDIYKTGITHENKIYKPFLIKDPDGSGRYILDSAKLSKAFGDNDTAQRLKEALPEFKKYLQDNAEIFPNVQEQMSALDKLDKIIGVSENSRLIGRARTNPSGTGAYNARNDNLSGNKTKFLSNLVANPVDVMQGVSQFKKQYSDLFAGDERKIARAYKWTMENMDKATPQEIAKMYQSIAKGK